MVLLKFSLAAGVATFAQSVPELNHAQCGVVAAAHIADELQLISTVLIRMVMRSAGQARKGREGSVVPCFPEIDVGTALVILPAGAGDAVFFCKAN
ncbi:MAG: hypothetical protein RSC43_06785 [Clostridia bacterium]